MPAPPGTPRVTTPVWVVSTVTRIGVSIAIIRIDVSVAVTRIGVAVAIVGVTRADVDRLPLHQNAAPSINAKGQADAGKGSVLRSAMFSIRLERRRQFNRLAVLTAVTLLAVGTALITVCAVRAFDMLGAAEADRAPIITGVLIALAVLVVLCLIAYTAVRAVGHFTSR
jgi:uncharacterized membrane protein (DUF485 family)